MKSKLTQKFVTRFVDFRFTILGLAIIALLAYATTLVSTELSYWAAFGILVVAWLLVGLTTLADD